MLGGIKTAALGAAAVAALSVAPAIATPILVSNGETHSISAGSEFIGDVKTTGGAGTYEVQFDSTQDPLLASALATIGKIVAGTFTDLTLSWVSAIDNSVLASIAVTPDVTSLATNFNSGPPDVLKQKLIFSWTNSSVPGAGFDFEVAAVPLPAGGLLLLSALGGIAVIRRRKSAAA